MDSTVEFHILFFFISGIHLSRHKHRCDPYSCRSLCQTSESSSLSQCHGSILWLEWAEAEMYGAPTSWSLGHTLVPESHGVSYTQSSWYVDSLKSRQVSPQLRPDRDCRKKFYIIPIITKKFDSQYQIYVWEIIVRYRVVKALESSDRYLRLSIDRMTNTWIR